MTIKIDMDMPKTCAECNLPCIMECYLKENAFFYGFANKRRHEECPLQEVKE